MDKKTRVIAGLGLLTAIVVVLQAMAIAIRFGVFNVTLVLIPIVIGAALYGYKAGAWLGFIFSVVVLFTDAGAFLAVSVPGTIITVIAKGTCAGLAAAFVFKALEKKNGTLAVAAAALAAPIVNTGLFLVGCSLFFAETLRGWGAAAGFNSLWKFMIVGLVGTNFVVETLINLLLIPVVYRLIGIAKKYFDR